MLTQFRGAREVPNPPGINVFDTDTRGVPKRLEPRLLFPLTVFNEPKAIAQHFAGILILSLLHEIIDEFFMMIGEDNIARAHGQVPKK